jgi:hypothetical protein
MKRLRVLITNILLTDRTGTECHVRDLACGLLRRGHAPVVYSTYLGDMARELSAATVPVVDDLRTLGDAPDVIHGHHFPETLTALLHFPGVPAVGVCHDATIWHDTPVDFPRLRRFVAVDEACRDRLITRHGLAEGRVPIIPNAVDLARFPKRAPLPLRPKRALVFSNYASDANYLSAVRAACARAELPLDVVGRSAGAPSADPGQLLGAYDLVFAKARCALEAIAVGAAVVLCGLEGDGPLVTPANFDQLRRWNLGRRALRSPVTAERLVHEIAGYDPAAAAQVSERVRAEANVDGMLDAWLALYADVIEEQRRREQLPDPAGWRSESRAAATAVRWLMPYYREIEEKGRLQQELVEQRERGAEQEARLAGREQLLAAQNRMLIELRAQLEHQRRFSTQVRSVVRRIGRRVLDATLLPRLLAGNR